ncbi:hypothetical protein PsorP6_001814 [Peronosclerospora sorghi]|uniref:Uncharacterized protein n=1 Tax=Peronosclerospora sorghi TaxID=230839 RepID=A0ACC0WWN4_9STRA|nr:hypothetical protein PsorP6_001814 [Peronosclerospora sorghi]
MVGLLSKRYRMVDKITETLAPFPAISLEISFLQFKAPVFGISLAKWVVVLLGNGLELSPFGFPIVLKIKPSSMHTSVISKVSHWRLYIPAQCYILKIDTIGNPRH